MTMAETLDFLDAVKAYFPASYRGFTAQEAKSVVVVWQDAFADVPMDIMLSALKIHKDTGKFAPTVAEIRAALSSLHSAAGEFLDYPPFRDRVAPQELERRKRVYALTAPYAEEVRSAAAYLPDALPSGREPRYALESRWEP